MPKLYRQSKFPFNLHRVMLVSLEMVLVCSFTVALGCLCVCAWGVMPYYNITLCISTRLWVVTLATRQGPYICGVINDNSQYQCLKIVEGVFSL